MLHTFPWQARHSLPVLLLLLVIGALALFPMMWQFQLDFVANLIYQGEWWRLVSGHLIHSNLNHLALNSAGIIALWALHGHYYNGPRLITALFGSALLISFAVLLFADYDRYVGLSGCLHALFVIGMLEDFKRQDKTAWLLLAGLVIKLGYELSFGASEDLKAMIEVDVATKAHLYGAISGLIVFPLWQKIKLK
ncbi:rhombosortase [Catenovulum sp. SM1970]|uniref:rhombosortase n=1 Tax=Marinifaba aquimaris TaxID=2741323 RepID=UPI00157221C8|nr:rhombosortase [Marinifaba aquimaris]NTS78805.1 rhombosortase [Marinifaba aquimaris]